MMPAAAAVCPSVSLDRVTRTVARVLTIAPEGLDPTRPLTSYGLDSMSALQLVAELEDDFGLRLPDWLLHEHSTLSALVNALSGGEPADVEAELIAHDSVLPDDIRPAPESRHSHAHVLLTGATGFLGASLLHALLRDSGTRVTCLVRGDISHASQRVLQNLQQYRLWQSRFEQRLVIVSGDLSQPRLGMAVESYRELTQSIDGVYHAGAEVDWIQGYQALRDANVAGTVELLRLACTGAPKFFAFLSSLSVCYPSAGPGSVSEDTDMLPHVGNLPLGYARTKCVGEALVRQAASRGLSARIFRPALLAGHTRTGAANLNDLIARLIRGCIQMGAAPDLNWTFDAIPVDYAARAIVTLTRGASSSPAVVHLAQQRPRGWRECVLWANAYGYRVRLLPFERWREQLERDASTPDHALHPLRGFFRRRPDGSRSVAEQYETHVRTVATDETSRAVLATARLRCPGLDANLLHRFFDDYVSRGFLPAVPRSRARPGSTSSMLSHVAGALRRRSRDDSLRITRARRLQEGSEHSILGELTRWRRGSSAGISQYRLELDGRRGRQEMTVVIKNKTADHDVLDMSETLARVCDPRVAFEMRQARELVGIRGSHVRELAIYDMRDARLRRHIPRCHGTWRSDVSASYGLVLERLDDMALLDATDDVALWTEPCIHAAIDGLAAIHSVWSGRQRELAKRPWIGYIQTLETADRLAGLWQALASHAAPRFSAAAGAALARTHRQLAVDPRRWWPVLFELPRTLIHNDFNTRNIGIRRTSTGLRLVAYDWELATIGAPQRDLAELLCFVLPEDVDARVVDGWVEHHRIRLESETGSHLPGVLWRAGFAAALAELLVGRLAFYALIDRVVPQLFLSRVLRTWWRLWSLGDEARDLRVT